MVGFTYMGLSTLAVMYLVQVLRDDMRARLFTNRPKSWRTYKVLTYRLETSRLWIRGKG
jgi:hypothetical protein